MRRKLFDAIRIFGAPLCALRFADGGGSGGAGDAGTGDGEKSESGGDAGAGDAGAGNGGEEEKKFTQADMDAEVTKRLARAQKKWDREHPTPPSPTPPTPPAAGADGGTQQTQQQPKDDSAAKIAKANQRIVATEAKAVALASGVKPDKVAYVVKLAELGGVDVDEDDGPDTDAIKKAVEKVLKDMPEFKAAPDDGKGGGSGFQIGANGSNQGTAQQTQQPQGAAQPTSTKRWNRFR